MATALPLLPSALHASYNPPSQSVFSTSRATAALPQLAPRNPYSNQPFITANGRDNNPLVMAGNLSNRYQPYPQPQVLAPDPRIDSGVIQPPAPANAPYPEYTVDAMVTDNFTPTTAVLDYGAGTTSVPEVDIVDVEMEDDFLPEIPAIIVTPPDDDAQESFVFG